MKLTFQTEIDNFAKKVKYFCEWVESEFSEPVEELQKVEFLLTELHLGILRLPEARAIWDEIEDLADFEDDPEGLKIEWKICREKYAKLPIDEYWEIFDAGNIEDRDPVFALVSDDLADIYGDLKIGLLLYETSMFPEAFWEWRFNFQIHWGNHLVGAQKAIRNYISFQTES